VSAADPTKLRWIKSSRSGAAECVEIAFTDDAVFVRDSKDPQGPMLRFSLAAWRSYVLHARSDDDQPSSRS